MTEKKPAPEIEDILGWRVCHNRIGPILTPIFQRVNYYMVKDCTDQQLRERNLLRENMVFGYVSTFNTAKPDVLDRPNTITAVDCSGINYISDKLLMSREMKRLGLMDHFPTTYELVSEARQAVDATKSPILFIKNRIGTDGRSVFCIKSKDLWSFAPPNGYIIQEAIPNIELYQDRKLEFRWHVFIWNQQIYLGKYAMAYKHAGDKFNPEDIDWTMQVRKTKGMDLGTAVDNSRPEIWPIHTEQNGDRYFAAIKELLKNILPILEPIRLQTNDRLFQTLGCDSVLCEDGRMRLIEINHYPNYMQTTKCNTEINIPYWSSIILKMFLNIDTEELILIKN